MTNLEQLLDLYKVLKLEELLWEAEKKAGLVGNGAINPIL